MYTYTVGYSDRPPDVKAQKYLCMIILSDWILFDDVIMTFREYSRGFAARQFICVETLLLIILAIRGCMYRCLGLADGRREGVAPYLFL